MKRIIAVVLIGLMFSGCAVFQPYADLKPVEKAKVSVETLSSWYYNTHIELDKKYEAAKEEGDTVTMEFLNKNIFPKMDEIKPLIIRHNKLILLWEETNTKPQDIEALVREIERLIFGVIDALT